MYVYLKGVHLLLWTCVHVMGGGSVHVCVCTCMCI